MEIGRRAEPTRADSKNVLSVDLCIPLCRLETSEFGQSVFSRCFSLVFDAFSFSCILCILCILIFVLYKIYIYIYVLIYISVYV